MTWLLAVLAIAGGSAADDNLLKFWDAPRRETFAMKKATAQEAAMEVRRRFGFEFALEGSIVDPVDFKAKDATFLEALDRLGGPLGLYLVGVPAPEAKREWDRAALALVRPETPIAPAIFAHVGPSRISVESVSALAVARCAPPSAVRIPDIAGAGIPVRIRRLVLAEETERPFLAVSLRWIVEPGFEDVVWMSVALGQVVDDRGEPVKTLRDPPLPVAANGELRLDFERPSRKAKSLKKVQANARFAVPTERGEIAFASTESGVTRTLGHASITLDSVDSTAVPATARFTLAGTPSGLSFSQGLAVIAVSTDRSGAGGIPALTVIAYDAKGAEVRGYEGSGSWDSKLARGTHNITFEGAPARLVFRAITNMAVREGQFTLNAIPIPE